MSSRNRFVPPEQRERALSLSRALDAACAETDPGAAEAAMRRVYAEHGVEPDYAAVRDAETLGPCTAREARAGDHRGGHPGGGDGGAPAR
jgi:pantoate--beta-alanine ligase